MIRTQDSAPANSELWPTPDYDPVRQPHFLFILTPPSSGSTALAKILNTGERSMLLHRRGEGQWLVPGLCQNDRWLKDKPVDYDSIKAVWLAKFQQRWAHNNELELVIEKSPPNMVRFERLIGQFERYTLLANNRDPIANCASRLHRQGSAAEQSEAGRIKALSRLVRAWLDLSRLIRQLVIELQVPLLTYEHFCSDPLSIFDRLELPAHIVQEIDLSARIKVKDYAAAGIANKNTEQINRLSPGEVAHLVDELQGEEELLSFFGYVAEIPSSYTYATPGAHLAEQGAGASVEK